MAITVKHKFVSAIPDAGDPTIVQPSNWNDDHELTGTIPVANGGTGASTLTGYVIGNGTSAMTASTTIPSSAITGLGTMSTQNANAVAITGGAIDGTTIGATTTSTGKFTTLNASTSLTTPIVQASNSGGLSLKNSAGTTQMSMGAGGGDNMSINVSTNLNGTNAQIDISPTGTGHVHMKPSGTGSVEIAPTNVGTMDNITIGATTAVAGSFTNLSVTGTTKFDGAEGTVGQVLTSAGTGNTPTWTTPTTGTVTSVSGTAPVSVATGTTTPVISLATAYGDTQNPYASKTANYFLAAPDGSAGVPTFRAVVAADIPTLNQNTTGSAAKWTTARTESLTGDITGSTTVDGSANWSISTTLATVNSNVGTFTKITVNGKGLATAATQASLTDLSSPTASFSFGSQLLTNLLDPVSAQDGATKNYVDSVAQGLDAKASCVCGTTVNITLSGAQTIDGVAVVAGDRVLVKNQTASADNGIYVASASAWSRATDMNTWAEVPNSFTFLEGGTTQADTGWVCTAQQGGTLGVTAIIWTQFSGAGTYTAGTGLTLTGTQFSITNVGTAGTYGSATQTPVFATNAQGQVTSVTNTTITPAVGSITGLGTGVATALAVNTGSAGAFVVNGGALGTPSSGTVTNLTGTASININGTVGATTATTGAFTTVSASGVITSTIATGTAPFTVTSTTAVTNLSIGGNAGTVTNGVYTTGSYADPTWITSLAGSKITGTIDGGTF
jgi:hypothetical protein